MVQKLVLFLDSVHPLIAEKLSSVGLVCEFDTSSPREEVLQKIPRYSGIIIRSRIRIDKEFLLAAENLKFIGRVGAGMENIDVTFAESRRIKCLNSPEGNRDAVGEHTVGMLLSIMNNMGRADREVRNGIWRREENRGSEIKGKTVGIIGYGNMGSAFAKKLKGFEATVISYDKYKKDYSDGNTIEVSEDQIFEQSDILSLHIPLTEETKYLCDNLFFSKFSKNIWLINTSRGPVINTADLANQIRTGKVLGAALDVLEYEDASFERLGGKFPEAMEFLSSSDKVILTPHIAGWTVESNIKLAEFLVQKILTQYKPI